MMAGTGAAGDRRHPRREWSAAGAVTLAMLLVAALVVGCGDGGDELGAEDATDCRELGGGLVYLRYEQADGSTQVLVQPGLRYAEAQSSPGLSQQAREVLDLRGWDDDALSELQQEQGPSPEVTARLDAMPSCLAELQGDDGGR